MALADPGTFETFLFDEQPFSVLTPPVAGDSTGEFDDGDWLWDEQPYPEYARRDEGAVRFFIPWAWARNII